MKKKIVVLGGGTGMSSLLTGLKEFPVDITAVVSVCDDGRSTGRLREEFHIPAVGDVRKVLVSLSETDPLVEKLLNYSFKTTSDLNGHKVGNLLLTAMSNMTGNMSEGIEAIGKVLNLKGTVLPLTEDEVVLVGKMTDGSVVEGEHNITLCNKKIKEVYYQDEPKVNKKVIKAIDEADLIILSMGSIYTSIIPNLLCDAVIRAFDKEHVKIINHYLGRRKISVVVANDGKIDEKSRKRYESLEQKDPVKLDKENLTKVKLISNDYVTVEDELLRHDTILLSTDIFKYLITKK